MIKKINIDKFGKFSRKEISLGPVTVFHGKNEAGKTTLFDAIFYALCAPGKANVEGKNLHARYGDAPECKVVLEFLAQPRHYDPRSFLDLYAIRESDIRFEPVQGSDWMQALKNNLFSGGIDPEPMRRKFMQRADDKKGSFKHNKVLHNTLKWRDQLADELAGFIAKKTALLSDEATAHQSEGRIQELDEQIKVSIGTIDRLKEELGLQDNIVERKNNNMIMQEIDAAESIDRQISGLELYQVNAVAEIDAIEQTIKNIGDDVQRKTAAASVAQDEWRRAKTAMDRSEDDRRHFSNFLSISGANISKIKDFLIRQSQIRKIIWDLRLIGAAAGCIVIGGGACFLTKSFIPELTGMVIAVILMALARKLTTGGDAETERKFIEEIRSEVAVRTGASITLVLTTLESLQAEIYQKIDLENDVRGRALTAKASEFKQREADVSEKELLRTEAVELLSAQENTRRQWLERYRVGSRDDYAVKRTEYAGLLLRKAESAKKIQVIKDTAGLQDMSTLRLDAERKLKVLDEKAVPQEGWSDTEVRQLRLKLENETAHLKGLEATQSGIAKDMAGNVGKVMGGLADIPEKIVALERQILQADKEIETMQVEIKAYKMLGDIFGAFSHDASQVLGRLGHAVAAEFGDIIPAWKKIRVADLKQGSILVDDAAGALRTAEKLSTGAREAFILGIRLILALRSGDASQKHILVLDEPFRSLDPDKEMAMISLLKKFIDDHGWQLIIFTFDERTVKNLTSAFAGAVVNYL